jgi:LPPG:FO 2-phospho-L-lactate transferase
VRVVALAGGVGAGKFLRGLTRVVAPEDVTVIVNTADDLRVHGLYVSPDLDSVTYWLAGEADRERGWGRHGETFRATTELRERFDAEGSWFGLGDMDLATHLFRTSLMARGATLSEATARLVERFGIRASVVPMSDDPVTTRIEAVGADGAALSMDFQEYWVARGARDEVKAVRFSGVDRAVPAPAILEAVAGADAILFCPSNPVVSIGPILAVPGIREAVAARRDAVAGVSPIVGGAPLRGMADRLLPAWGVDVSAEGVALHYRDVIGGWVIDAVDSPAASRVRSAGLRVAVTDTVMVDDDAAEALARVALDTALGRSGGTPG